MIPAPPFVVRATLMQTPDRGLVEIVDNAAVVVGHDGTVEAVLRPDDPAHAATLAAARADGTLVETGRGRYLLPGLVDLHVHAPQFPQLGTALDAPLDVWLARYTFPLEARYADLAFADGVYRDLVATLLAHGTTTAVYYGSRHLPATQRLAEICLERGQRALVGRVAMDDPATCPPDYRDASATEAIAETASLVDHVRALPGNGAGRVLPVVTPRFIPACTDALLEGLGALAARCGCHVQTHCSEGDWEHAFVLARTGRTDTESLRGYGLVGRRSVLAHATHVTDDDMATIGAAGAGIAHCPLSNAYFADAVFPLARALGRGLHVGLGTDIAAGPEASLLANVREAAALARVRTAGVDAGLATPRRGTGDAHVDLATAFYLATAGGGIALDLPIGLIAPGYRFDAIVLDTAATDAEIPLYAGLYGPRDRFDKIIHAAGRTNVRQVFVDGRLVLDKDAEAAAMAAPRPVAGQDTRRG